MNFLPPNQNHSCRNGRFRVSLPENAVFWMVLLLLSIGCICSLYEKAANHTPSEASSPHDTIFNTAAEANIQKGKNLQASLTFNVFKGTENTEKTIEILEKYNVKATFFVTGSWAQKYPSDVKLITSQGHELGNLSENHKNMNQLEKKQIRQEIQLTHDKIKELAGVDMTLFRPPHGQCNKNIMAAADSMGYSIILWDVDSMDWKDYGASSIISQVLEHPKLSNGSIILLHIGAKYTPDALEGLITGLQERGYELVPASKLITPAR